VKKSVRKNIIIGFLGTIIFFLGFSFRGFFNKPNQNTTNNIIFSNPQEGKYRVIRVLDGDTVELEKLGKFRYLGIDAPELNDRWGPEAKVFNEEMVLNKKIRVELDQKTVDVYGRTLGYIWVNNVLVNEALIERGYAKVNMMKGEVKPKYLDRLQKAQDWARQNHDGIWFDEWESNIK